jgi:hypothetical protein
MRRSGKRGNRFCELASDRDRCGIGDLAHNLPRSVDAGILIAIRAGEL